MTINHSFSGGTPVDPFDPECTHIIVNSIAGDMPDSKFDFKQVHHLNHVFVVYKEWFWSSIVNEGNMDEFQEEFVFPFKVSYLFKINLYFCCFIAL